MFYNSWFQSVFDFWIKLSKRNVAKMRKKVNGFAVKSGTKHKRVRDTSLWKFIPFSRQAECEKFRLCHDTGSACYGCFRHSQRVCRCLENYSFGTEGTGKVKDR